MAEDRKKFFREGELMEALIDDIDRQELLQLQRLVSDPADPINLADYPKGNTAFISRDGNVINMGGENYYRSCGVPVRELTSCVKRVGHRAKHEDYYGEEAD